MATSHRQSEQTDGAVPSDFADERCAVTATRTNVTDLATETFRQRLLIEGYFTRAVSEAVIREYLLGLAARLGLRTYGEPVVFTPGEGMDREKNAGFDAFVPLIDSGISGYFWTGPRFLSVVLYTCKGFDEAAAIAYTREFFVIEGESVTHAF